MWKSFHNSPHWNIGERADDVQRMCAARSALICSVLQLAAAQLLLMGALDFADGSGNKQFVLQALIKKKDETASKLWTKWRKTKPQVAKEIRRLTHRLERNKAARHLQIIEESGVKFHALMSWCRPQLGTLQSILIKIGALCGNTDCTPGAQLSPVDIPLAYRDLLDKILSSSREETAAWLKTCEIELEEYFAAREPVIGSLLRYIVFASGRFARGGLQAADLVQVGCIGALSAAWHFDPHRQTKFITYASKCITRRMGAYADNEVRFGRAGSTHLAKTIRITTLRHDQQAALIGRYWTLCHQQRKIVQCDEAAEILGVSCLVLEALVHKREYADIDPEHRTPVVQQLEIPLIRESPAAEDYPVIYESLNRLNYRDREILCLHYGLGDGYEYTFAEIGSIFKITNSRAQQLESRAKPKLANSLKQRGYGYNFWFT